MCVDLCIQFTLILWHPNPQQDYVLYVLATMWGLTDAIWQTQINSQHFNLLSFICKNTFKPYSKREWWIEARRLHWTVALIMCNVANGTALVYTTLITTHL